MVEIIGKISVPTPGTPVAVATHALVVAAMSAQGLAAFKTVQAILFQAWTANTGKVYVGDAQMVKATGAHCAATLPIPTDNALGSFGASNHLSPAGIDLTQFYLDADQANDGALVTLLVT